MTGYPDYLAQALERYAHESGVRLVLVADTARIEIETRSWVQRLFGYEVNGNSISNGYEHHPYLIREDWGKPLLTEKWPTKWRIWHIPFYVRVRRRLLPLRPPLLRTWFACRPFRAHSRRQHYRNKRNYSRQAIRRKAGL